MADLVNEGLLEKLHGKVREDRSSGKTRGTTEGVQSKTCGTTEVP